MSDDGQAGFSRSTQDIGQPGAPDDESTSTSNRTPVAGGSTTETAKGQAGQVAHDAKQSGRQVAGTAAGEGKQVLAEGRRQARDLAAQAGQQVDEQTRVQKDKASAGLRDLADELHAIANGNGGQSGIATDLAQQAATRVHDVAGWLESRNPGEIIDELRTVARRRPGAFLLAAVAAGAVAGRLTRGAVDAVRPEVDTSPAADGRAPVASYGVPAASDAPDVDLTSAPVTIPVETTTGRELYAESDDPLYTGTSMGGNR